MNTITFESIQQSVNTLDLEAFTGKAAAADQITRVQRVLASYRAVRPILSALSVVPLIPPQFRDALRLFLATVDQFADSATGDFKAGKDL